MASLVSVSGFISFRFDFYLVNGSFLVLLVLLLLWSGCGQSFFWSGVTVFVVVCSCFLVLSVVVVVDLLIIYKKEKKL